MSRRRGSQVGTELRSKADGRAAVERVCWEAAGELKEAEKHAGEPGPGATSSSRCAKGNWADGAAGGGPRPGGDAQMWDEFAYSTPSTGVMHCLKDPGGPEAGVRKAVSDGCRGVSTEEGLVSV